MKKDAEQMKKYTDFKERFQKVLNCDEKPVRAIRLDELYREVYSYCKGAVLTPEILTLFWPLLEDIFRALEDAGEAYPGIQKQVESFLKAINEAKQYAPEKKLAAADALITNAVAIKTNDPRTEKRMQGVIYLCERLKVEALAVMAPEAAAPGDVPTEPMSNYKTEREWRKGTGLTQKGFRNRIKSVTGNNMSKYKYPKKNEYAFPTRFIPEITKKSNRKQPA